MVNRLRYGGFSRTVKDATGGRVYINHVVLVLDASSSMGHLRLKLIKVVDTLIKHLANRSRELNQETRVTVYTFDSEVSCLFFDVDVLRLPSIAEFYRTRGMTALVDATLFSQEDLRKTATMYGDHAFLTYVLTDGEENTSDRSPSDLKRWMENLLANETVGALVPDQSGVHEAKKCGFPVGNIAVWDATTERGMEKAAATITRATDAYMTMRTKGVRSTTTLFAGGAEQVNTRTVAAAGLVPLQMAQYSIHQVTMVGTLAIRPYVELMTGSKYRTGSAFYQLTKPELVQGNKTVAVRRKGTGEIYVGANARALLGLPDASQRVRPADNKDFDVFIQSTSVNRKLVPGTDLLILSAGAW